MEPTIETQNPADGYSNMQKGGAQEEGTLTKRIENMTSALPSSLWLGVGLGAMAGSLVLKVMGFSKTATFVGQWVPTILILGLYNKIVKVAGNDQSDQGGTGFSGKGKKQR